MGNGGIFGRAVRGGSLGADEEGCAGVLASLAASCADRSAVGIPQCLYYVNEALNSGCISAPQAEQYRLNTGTGTKTGVSKSAPVASDFSGQACNSDAVIRMVQGVIGASADGKWGPASQTALQKAGGTFQSYAPGCTGNPPSYGAITGGGGGGTVTTTTAVPPMAMPGTSSMSGLLSKPIVWVGLAMAAVGGYVLLTGKKKGGKVRRNAARRRMSTAKRAKTKIVKISWGGTRKKPRNRVNDILMQVEAGAYFLEGGSPFGKGNLRDAVARARRAHIGETRIATAIARGKAGAKRWLKR